MDRRKDRYMLRRELFTSGAALAASQIKGAAPARRVRMKVGTQHARSDRTLSVLAALGCEHVCLSSPSKTLDEKWSVDGLKRMRERVEKFGLHLDMVELPTNSTITNSGVKHVLLGKSPERDREIDGICQMIRNTAQAGIPNLKYNLTVLAVVRTPSVPGRGSSMYSAFDYSKVKEDPPLTEAGAVGIEETWQRITYFLDRVAPAAQEYKVRIGCHPHDPPMPRGKAFRGIHRVMGSVEGLKRFVSIRENPYHGLNFCQGTVSEMLEKPGEQIYDVIRYFGQRKKIFNVHFRNIRGGFLNFQETFPDNGDVNLIRALRVYKEVDYDGMIMPDHVPKIPGDEGGEQAFAYAFGYINALFQLVNQEA
jgi:mannonate dehydratase